MKLHRLTAAIATLLLGIATPSPAEDDIVPLLKAQTVMITVTRESGGPENGAGIILCQIDEQTYILTARHVLFGRALEGQRAPGLSDISRVEVNFYKNIAPPVLEPNEQGEEVITQQTPGRKKDLLLLTVPVRTVLTAKASLGLAPKGTEIDGRPPKVYAIGYRHGKDSESWALAEGTLLRPGIEEGTLIKHEAEELRHSAPITRGFSGGPLFDEAGALIGINLGDDENKLSRALPIEQVIETIDKWLPAACLSSENPLQQLAYSIYRRGMQAASTKDWSAAKQLMEEALKKWPWEGGSLHLQGMRYTLYLPRYHLGLALYHLPDRQCGEVLREWSRSEVQGAIQEDGKRYRKMQRLRRKCTEVLQRQFRETSTAEKEEAE